MKAKNYICTAEGFVKDVSVSGKGTQLYVTEVHYTDKLREAMPFGTKTAETFMERHNIKGFIWKPFAEEPVRNSYTVRKRSNCFFEDDKDAIGWIPEKLTMTSDSDIGFLMSSKLKSEEAMTFEEAKAEALRLNTEILSELMGKIDNLKTKTENDR